ncbi:MAG: septum site-determining protein MinC [Cyanobacteria bacterium J083]|nr:MAG: septum site-determining protein MinC [Cyanobacteria bacterium J083]
MSEQESKDIDLLPELTKNSLSTAKNDLEKTSSGEEQENAASTEAKEQETEAESSETLLLLDNYLPISLERQAQQLWLTLPPQEEVNDLDWQQVWLQLKYKINASKQELFPAESVYLQAQDRLLDIRQLQAISESLAELDLNLTSVATKRRQTAVAAATVGYAVQQQVSITPASQAANVAKEDASLQPPLYLQTTIRSGVEVRHSGTVIVLGDLNPGGTIIAAKDIFIWGRLRGVAHAGSSGDRQARIMALEMQPGIQLRIADVVATVPSPTSVVHHQPEIVYLTAQGIGIAKAIDFAKNHRFVEAKGHWIEIVNLFNQR